jgi:hypothetical protein
MPRTPRRRERRATLSDRIHPASSNQRNSVGIEQLGEGCIAWLPFRGDEDGIIKCIRDSYRFNSELDEESYNHPVLVLRKEILAEYNGSVIEVSGP